MVLVAYLDDAGTDSQNQFVSLSGFIGTVDAWAAFEEDGRSVMDAFDVTYIRGRDLWASDGDYADQEKWTVDHKIRFIESINEKLAPRVGLGVSFGTLKSKFRERSHGRTMIQSPFGFAFEMLFHALLKDEGFMNTVAIPGVDLSWVIEEGNSNNAEILQRYQRLKRDHGNELPFLAHMAFEKKNSSVAIQVADLFAFLTRRHAEAIEANTRQQTTEHSYLSALRKNIRCIGRASTDFGFCD